MPARSRIFAAILRAGLGLVTCSAPGCKGIDGTEEGTAATAEPPRVAAKNAAGGALLKTGAFQLGPGVSHDLLRSQGDGLQGFPMP